MDRQGRMEKENKTLRTERCENIDTLYINKQIKLNIDKFQSNDQPEDQRKVFTHRSTLLMVFSIELHLYDGNDSDLNIF